MSVGVDVLTLTATPIPRTLEMALTGIREVSHIRTAPEDRHPILTFVGPYDDQTVSAAIRRELLRDGQVFYVHNRVQSIDRAVARLHELVPDARIVTAHGQMSEGQLEQVMIDFWNGDYDVMVGDHDHRIRPRSSPGEHPDSGTSRSPRVGPALSAEGEGRTVESTCLCLPLSPPRANAERRRIPEARGHRRSHRPGLRVSACAPRSRDQGGGFHSW